MNERIHSSDVAVIGVGVESPWRYFVLNVPLHTVLDKRQQVLKNWRAVTLDIHALDTRREHVGACVDHILLGALNVEMNQINEKVRREEAFEAVSKNVETIAVTVRRHPDHTGAVVHIRVGPDKCDGCVFRRDSTVDGKELAGGDAV